MKKGLKIIGQGIIALIIAEMSFVGLWLFLALGCFDYAENREQNWQACGDNTMTRIIQWQANKIMNLL